MRLSDYSIAAANWIASPLVQIGIPVACISWLHAGLGEGTLTLILSILALTFSQLVLAGSRRFESAVNARLDELIRIFPEARDELLHAEDKSEREINELRT